MSEAQFDRLTDPCCSFTTRLEREMRSASIAVAFTVLLAASNVSAKTKQPCIPKAIEALPHIAGLVVKQTRTRPVSAEILATWKGQSRPIIVDVDVVEDGTQETLSYLCAVTQGSAFVQRTAN
jgi:hypothetical protein